MTISRYKKIKNLSCQEQLDLGAFIAVQLEDQDWQVYDSKGQCIEEDCSVQAKKYQRHYSKAKFCYLCGNELIQQYDLKDKVDEMLYEMFIRTLERFSK
jgi:tRNA A37 threonylcarbamoyladenosine modification protein TsaB